MDENQIGTLIVALKSVERVIAAHKNHQWTTLSKNLGVRPSVPPGL